MYSLMEELSMIRKTLIALSLLSAIPMHAHEGYTSLINFYACTNTALTLAKGTGTALLGAWSIFGTWDAYQHGKKLLQTKKLPTREKSKLIAHAFAGTTVAVLSAYGAYCLGSSLYQE